MSTLKIRKLQSGAFKHVDSIDGDFFLGRFNFKQEFNKAFLVEAYGAKRREYVIANISVYNYLGTAETFTNWTDLINRLVDLGYTGIDTNSIPSGSGVWGSITGNIASQTDLQNELNTKLDKVTTVDVEKVYIKNADGTQGMKAVSEFGGSVQSVTGDSVDNTDTLNPIINAIPLSGTTVGNPVSGNIEIVGAGADLRIFSMGDSGILQNNITFGDGVFEFGVKNLIDGGGSAIQVHENYIEVIAQNDSVGIKGSEDFTLNITDLDYVQKKYVDTKVPKVSTAGVERAYIINADGSQGTKATSEWVNDNINGEIVNITTPSPNHTGTSAETNITSYNFVIPANTLSNGDTLRIENMLWEKKGVANTSNCRLKLSNTNNFATANQVAIFFNSSANIYMRACRTFNINSGLLRGVSFTANAIFNDFTLTNLGFSTLALDFTQPIYGFISLQLTNPADIILMRELKIRKI